ncbi:MAG TPA: hypothetical protein RMH99_27810 [Sandaracinaceae bacterium LLY-WYZ-13_1]|nr:hypothetical protein [Sandaracinaceae bacterium LLY-WYZ-13_1]
MSTSYQTLELIASHHAELDRLCEDLLERGSRIPPEDPEREAFRERLRALGWRLRAHRAEEAAALMAEAGDGRDRLARLMTEHGHEVEQIEAILERSSDDAPLELARAVTEAARSCRANLDRLARRV